MFKVLSDPNRLQIFEILLSGVHCNCELGKLAGLPNNLVSHHLKALSEAGMVLSMRSQEDARWIYYTVNETKLAEFRDLFDRVMRVDTNQQRNPNCGCKD